MGTPQTCNFPDHVKGDTYKGREFEILINGVAFDFTGCKIEMQLKLEKKAGTVSYKTFTTEDDSIKIITGNKKFQIPEQVVDVPARNYYYDIEITTADTIPKVLTYISGRWNIIQDVTNG